MGYYSRCPSRPSLLSVLPAAAVCVAAALCLLGGHTHTPTLPLPEPSELHDRVGETLSKRKDRNDKMARKRRAKK
ncbi:hypothetical protein NDU88_003853 [Pleurodeles waltl]|uniref:Secreted protein n=1 Tax=Pleurodeles waltl TaxID=8319 RepID=A0AAV7TPK0_PLEWA|nr:hypothetical protein NDU88_003853 [Pleurodeles waltl]